MAWIESHDTLGAHPKTRKIARLLGVSRVQVVGHLQFFWWWAMSYAPDGDITRFDDLDLATGAEWDGDESLFAQAMIQAGFVDSSDSGRRTIHDWDQYGGKLVRRKEHNAQQMRASRAQDVSNTKPEPEAHETRESTHVLNTKETRVQHVGESVDPEKRRVEKRRVEKRREEDERKEKPPTVEAPQAAAPPIPPEKPNPPREPKPKSVAQINAAKLYERRMVIFEAFLRGLNIASDSLAATQRKGPSLQALSPAILDTPECSPEIIEPLTRFAATKFKWREGRTTPSLAEALAAFPDWEQAGSPDQPTPANVKKLDWNDHRRFKEGVGTGIIG